MTAAPIGVRAPGRLDDVDAYSAFYLKYHKRLMGYLRKGFRDCDVEAVAQETLCRALNHWEEVRRMASPWPWLAVTARNLARNNVRDEEDTEAVGLGVYDPDTCSAVDVAAEVEAADQLRRLGKAMGVLTPMQRQLFTVLVEEGLTSGQLARRLGMKPGAVRMHLFRMRGRLYERFIALGGQLSVLPLAVAHFLARRPRRRGFGVQQAPMLTGSAGFVFAVAVVAIGGAVLRLVPGGPVLTDAVGVSRQPRSVATQPSPALGGAWLRSPSSGSRGLGSQTPEQAPAVAYHVKLSKTPTRAGRAADAGMDVPTPLGSVHVWLPVTIQSPDPGYPCPLGVGC
jgi:RNA polymerase sigma factor (sigma-70 family)